MSMGSITGEVDIEYGVGRYGLRTFRPAIVRGEPYLVSASQDPIPMANPRFQVPVKWREFLTDSHPISWADGTCTAVCTRDSNSVYNWGGNLVATLQEQDYQELPHEPPVRNCRCGIYALDDLKDLYNEYPNYTTSVVAVISASGRTLEMSRGIRTQHARVVAYWVLNHSDNCTCRLCGTQKTQTRHIYGAYNRQYAYRQHYDYGNGYDFPYLECCQNQFFNATPWSEPDDMAVHYGLKATPIPRYINSNLKVRGSRAGKSGVDLSPILNHPPGAQGHYTFEIPWE